MRMDDASIVGTGRTFSLNGSGVSFGQTGLLVEDPDGAATFDGTSWITVPYVSSDNSTDRTFECWFKGTQARYLYSRDLSGAAKFHWLLIQGGKLQFGYYDYAGTSHTFSSVKTINDNNIHHVVLRMTNCNDALMTVDMYLDGALDTTYNAPVKTPTQANTVQNVDHYIGSRRNGAPWIGTIDEVAYYTYALSPTRIADHYTAGTTPPTSDAPVADFTYTVNGLDVTLDPTSSTIPPGVTLSSVNWSSTDPRFFVSGSATLVPKVWTAPEPGVYTVTVLLMTSEGPVTKTLDVVVPGNSVAIDSFTRTVASGWGAADIGGNWRGTTLLSTNGTEGQVTFTAAGQGASPALDDVSVKDVDLVFEFKVSQHPTAGPLYLTPHIRIQDVSSDNSYRPKIRIQSGAYNLQWTKHIGGADVNIDAGYTQLLSGVSDNTWVRFRFQVFGDSPATLRGRAWVASNPEPSSWVEATDTDASIEAPGSLSFENYLSGAAGILPTVSYDKISATPIETANEPPTCSITADQTTNVEPWSIVTLSLSDNDDQGVTSRSLTQTGGPTVSISGTVGNGEDLTFEAPAVMGGTTLTFEYEVGDGTESDTDSVDIVVMTPAMSVAQPDGSENPLRVFLVS